MYQRDRFTVLCYVAIVKKLVAVLLPDRDDIDIVNSLTEHAFKNAELIIEAHDCQLDAVNVDLGPLCLFTHLLYYVVYYHNISDGKHAVWSEKQRG